jgi:two-component system phosphate regulon response regulator PhoB
MHQLILLIVAEGEAAERIAGTINSTAWKIERVELGSGALVAAARLEPSAILLEARHDSEANVRFCGTLRAIDRTADVHLIALVGDAADRLLLLEAGADDCWAEPPGSREFELRLSSVHRRHRPGRSGRLLIQGDMELDLDRYTVRARRGLVQLTAMQLKVLRHFVENPGVIFSRGELLEQVWRNPDLDEGAVTACIVRIRRALAAAGSSSIIRNVRSTGGYLLERQAAFAHGSASADVAAWTSPGTITRP